jgi:hypothetical protein
LKQGYIPALQFQKQIPELAFDNTTKKNCNQELQHANLQSIQVEMKLIGYRSLKKTTISVGCQVFSHFGGLIGCLSPI